MLTWLVQWPRFADLATCLYERLRLFSRALTALSLYSFFFGSTASVCRCSVLVLGGERIHAPCVVPSFAASKFTKERVSRVFFSPWSPNPEPLPPGLQQIRLQVCCFFANDAPAVGKFTKSASERGLRGCACANLRLETTGKHIKSQNETAISRD